MEYSNRLLLKVTFYNAAHHFLIFFQHFNLIFYFFATNEGSSRIQLPQKRLRLSSEEPELPIHIMFRNEKLQFAMEPTETIGALKQKIQHTECIAVDHQKLSLESAPLSLLTNERTLLEYGIDSRCTLLLEFVVNHRIQFSVLSQEGWRIMFKAIPEFKLWNLMLHLHKRMALLPSKQQLVYDGKKNSIMASKIIPKVKFSIRKLGEAVGNYSCFSLNCIAQ